MVIEDDLNDQVFIVEAFRDIGAENPIHVVRNAAEAVKPSSKANCETTWRPTVPVAPITSIGFMQNHPTGAVPRESR